MTEGSTNTKTCREKSSTEDDSTVQEAFSDRQLREIFAGGKGIDPLDEMKRIFTAIAPQEDPELLVQVHGDLNHIFAGDFQGFRESHVKYHDLRHTRNVALATLRLFHGLHCEGITLPPGHITLGLICAYFHDTGMLLTEDDKELSGAAYLKSHEERSIAFTRQYLRENNFPSSYSDHCESIINCTNLTIEPQDITFTSTDLLIVGHVLGTADILAQMADRYYLECLPLLYLEQQDAGIQQHPSSLALMRQTTRFYHDVIENRLQKAFHCRFEAMRTHFREWSRLDDNLYLTFIYKNIAYLEDVIRWYDRGEGDLALYLRRQQPKL